jgi:hypothetical protein
MTLEDLMQVDKNDPSEAAKRLDKNDIAQLVAWLGEKEDTIRYPSLLILQSRSKIADDVYPYRETFREKLKSDNSFQRSIGVMMIAENAKWDDGWLDGVIGEYLELLNDEKPITIRQCIQYLAKIVPYKPGLHSIITDALIALDLSAVKPRYFTSLRPHMYAYELRHCGQTVWGDGGAAESIPEFAFAMFQNFRHADLCQFRKLSGCFLEWRNLCHFAQRNSERLAILPEAELAKILRANWSIFGRPAEIGEHACATAGAGANVRMAQPDKNMWILRQASGTDARHSQKMKERALSERELLD